MVSVATQFFRQTYADETCAHYEGRVPHISGATRSAHCPIGDRADNYYWAQKQTEVANSSHGKGGLYIDKSDRELRCHRSKRPTDHGWEIVEDGHGQPRPI